MIKLLGLQVFDGPSIYSHKPVVRLLVKMEEYIDTPSTEIKGLYYHLVSHFPGLASHHCSKGYAGGFLERLEEGTYLAHIIEHLCLEIQSVLGYDVRYGKTRRAEDDCYDIVFGYKKRQIIRACIHFIMNFIISFLDQLDFDFERGMDRIRELNKRLLPERYRPAAIPLISVAGTSGNTAVCSIISRLLQKAGYRTGMANAKGLFRNDICMERRYAANYSGARKILSNPSMDAAILETGWQSILHEGLAYSKADVGVLTGLDADCPMLHIQSLVAEAVKQDGASVLNADDRHIVPLMERAKGRIILFAQKGDTPVIRNHMIRGGEAIFPDRECIYSVRDRTKRSLARLEDIPLSSGTVDGGNHPALAAAAVCSALGIPLGRAGDHLLQKLGTARTSSV